MKETEDLVLLDTNILIYAEQQQEEYHVKDFEPIPGIEVLNPSEIETEEGAETEETEEE